MNEDRGPRVNGAEELPSDFFCSPQPLCRVPQWRCKRNLPSAPIFSPQKYPILHYLFNVHVGHTCFVPGTVLGVGDPVVNKAGKTLPSGADVLVGGCRVIDNKEKSVSKIEAMLEKSALGKNKQEMEIKTDGLKIGWSGKVHGEGSIFFF